MRKRGTGMRPFAFRKIDIFPGDVLGLSSINAEVPTPDALVDIEVALRELKSDLMNVAEIYSWGAEPSLEGNWRILLNHRAWEEFFSVRHPNPAVRERYKLELQVSNQIIQRLAARVERYLARRAQC